MLKRFYNHLMDSSNVAIVLVIYGSLVFSSIMELVMDNAEKLPVIRNLIILK